MAQAAEESMLNRWGWLVLLLAVALVGCNTFEDLGDYRYDQSKVDVDTDSGDVDVPEPDQGDADLVEPDETEVPPDEEVEPDEVDLEDDEVDLEDDEVEELDEVELDEEIEDIELDEMDVEDEPDCEGQSTECVGSVPPVFRFCKNGRWEEVSCQEGDVCSPVGCESCPEGFEHVKAGTFQMGAGNFGATPVHEVELTRPLCVSATEVTEAQYKQVMGVLPPGMPSGGDNHPVSRVRYHDAADYCNRLSQENGFTETQKCYDCTPDCAPPVGSNPYDCPAFRLPTEAEWEYVMRAGTTWDYYDSPPHDPEALAWFDANAEEKQEVKRRAPNGNRIYDGLGNVREWCHDCDEPYPDPAVPRVDPAKAETGFVCMRPLRGGSFYDGFAETTLGHREFDFPGSNPPYVGFRVVVRPSIYPAPPPP